MFSAWRNSAGARGGRVGGALIGPSERTLQHRERWGKSQPAVPTSLKDGRHIEGKKGLVRARTRIENCLPAYEMSWFPHKYDSVVAALRLGRVLGKLPIWQPVTGRPSLEALHSHFRDSFASFTCVRVVRQTPPQKRRERKRNCHPTLFLSATRRMPIGRMPIERTALRPYPTLRFPKCLSIV
jgi:hypothetical protein